MSKTLLCVGAGIYQIPGIQKAKQMGLRVIAVDGNPQAEGFALADKHYALDVLDAGAVIKVGRENSVDGVMTVASDICVPTVAAVAEALKLPGISCAAARNATNKFYMRTQFLKYKLASPKFFKAGSLAEFLEGIKGIGFPVVIKPVDNAGSRGVTVVKKKSELREAFDHAVSHSRTKEVIAEEFVNGTECTIEAMTLNGQTEILGISEKKKPAGKYRVATDLIYPPKFSKKVIKEIEDLVKKAVTALEINMGPTHTEVLVTPKGKPVLVEMAARGGGFKIFSDIIPRISGVDVVEQTIRMSLGMKADITPKWRRSAVLHFFAPQPGILRKVAGLDEARSLKDVEVGLFKKIGEEISVLATDGSRTGYAISWADGRANAVAKVRRIDRLMKFTVEKL